MKIYTTICPRSSDPFYEVAYFIKGASTSWTHGIIKGGTECIIMQTAAITIPINFATAGE